jgi:hypothetical protein
MGGFEAAGAAAVKIARLIMKNLSWVAVSTPFLLGACASPPPVPQTAQVRDADGTLYPIKVRVMCKWPKASSSLAMSQDCAAGGGTIGALATSGPPLPEEGIPITLTPKQQQAVRAGVAKGMKDPESARFGDTMAGAKKVDGTITVCGYVNGKNSYGGYVGMSPFVGILADGPNGPFGLIDIGSSAADRPFIVKTCRDSGVEGIS